MKINKHIRANLKNFFLGLIFLAAALAAHAQSWTNYYDGGPNEVVFALALDGGGNVLVNGLSQGTGGYYHLTTIKYSNAGLPLWTNNYDAPGNAYLEPAGVAVDGSGNPIATAAWFDNTGYRNFATIKYSSSGVPLWTNYYGHTAGGNDTPRPRSIAVDSAGNVFVAGDSENTAGEPWSTDVVIIKYSGAGVPLWTNRFNGPANADDGVYGGLALDSAGNVIVACASGIGSRHEILKYSSAGALVWARYYHGPALTPLADAPYAIAVDAANNVFVAGDSVRTVTIDGSPVTRADLVTIKYSAGGTPLWTNLYQGGLDEVSDSAKALALDANGNVLVTGVQDGGFIPADCVTIKYSGAGVPLWTNIYSGPSDRQRYPSAIAVDGVGDVFVTGRSAFEYPTIKYSSGGVPL